MKIETTKIELSQEEFSLFLKTIHEQPIRTELFKNILANLAEVMKQTKPRRHKPIEELAKKLLEARKTTRRKKSKRRAKRKKGKAGGKQ